MSPSSCDDDNNKKRTPLFDEVLPKLRPFRREAVDFATQGTQYRRQFHYSSTKTAEAASSSDSSNKDSKNTHLLDDSSNNNSFTDRSLWGRGKILLADEMGTGKTITSLAIMAYYQHEWPLLILCPASLKQIWPAEIEKFFRKL